MKDKKSRLYSGKDLPAELMDLFSASADTDIGRLRQDACKYGLLSANMNDLVGIIGADLRFKFISPSVERILGYSVEEAFELNVEKLLTPGSFAKSRDLIGYQISIDGGPGIDPDRGFIDEMQIVHKNGSLLWFEMKGTFIRDKTGKIAAILGVGRDVSLRKSMEESITRNERRYASFLEHFSGIAYQYSVEGQTLMLHGAVEGISGYPVNDFMEGKRRWEDQIDPRDDAVRGIWRKVCSTPGFKAKMEYRIISRQGDIRWMSESCQNIEAGYGGGFVVEGVIQDITERKVAADELMWQASFPELNPLPVIEAEIDGEITYMNPSALRYFPDLQARGFEHPFFKGISSLLDKLSRDKKQYAARDVESSGRWFSQTVYLVESSARFRVYSSDITENKTFSDRLRQVNRQLHDIIEFLPDPTFVLDSNRRVIAWNRALEEMTGIIKEQIVGKGEYEYSVPFWGKRVPIVIDLIYGQGKEIEQRYNYVKRINNTIIAEAFEPCLYNGKGAFVWIKASPFIDETGRVNGAIETIREISELKQSEAVLRHDKEVFEELVKEKTSELLKMQKDLADARHLSEIGVLSATIAHELRNPLAAIRTAAYNIRRKSQDASLASHLDNIEKKVIVSDHIINNLLTYSNIRPPKREPVAVRKLIEDSVKAARDRFRRHKVSVKLKLTCEKTDYVDADPVQVRELFDNILNNAYESFLREKGSIVVVAEYKRGSGFEISFTDDGPGIKEEHLRKIFQPFFSTKPNGTGLGLAVCHQLVSLHGGKIDISSEPGRGTKVTVSLPVR